MIKGVISNLIYPPMCGICGKLSKEALCKKCERMLKQEEKVVIQKEEKFAYNEKIYCFEYKNNIRTAIIDYKYNEKPYLYESFVKFILKNKKVMEFLKSYDIIIPVPISWERYKKRGYNQTTLIAKCLAKEYNKIRKKKVLKVCKYCLLKTKHTKKQSTLNKEQRENNAIGVYTLINKQIINNKKILILDDVCTTGSTIRECSQMIKIAKPKAIGVITIAQACR